MRSAENEETHMGKGGSVTGFLLHPTARNARRRG